MCQNCVRSPLETLVKNIIYGDAPTRIAVAEVVDLELRWWAEEFGGNTRRRAVLELGDDELGDTVDGGEQVVECSITAPRTATSCLVFP